MNMIYRVIIKKLFAYICIHLETIIFKEADCHSGCDFFYYMDSRTRWIIPIELSQLRLQYQNLEKLKSQLSIFVFAKKSAPCKSINDIKKLTFFMGMKTWSILKEYQWKEQMRSDRSQQKQICSDYNSFECLWSQTMKHNIRATMGKNKSHHDYNSECYIWLYFLCQTQILGWHCT